MPILGSIAVSCEMLFVAEGVVLLFAGEVVGEAEWHGKLFVFDRRNVVEVGDGSAAVIGSCRHCAGSSEVFRNCCNVDCNELFLCCPACWEKHKGLCKRECADGRLRPFEELRGLTMNKFERYHAYRNGPSSDTPTVRRVHAVSYEQGPPPNAKDPNKVSTFPSIQPLARQRHK